MAKTGISEFTYGFAFLHEQVNNNVGNLVSAPILPSLIQEQEEGWDAKLPLNGCAFFYQFKLSDYLTRSNARFMGGNPYWNPYYCFSLHRNNNSQQHNRLKKLSKTEPNTFYVAPEFNGVSAFNSAYLKGEVSKHSRVIPLSQCHLINDSAQHYITYQPGNPAWNQHSEIKTSDVSYQGDRLEDLYERVRDRARSVDLDFAIQIYESITSPLFDEFKTERFSFSREEKELLNLRDQNETLKTKLQRTSRVLSVFYGATLVLVGTGRDK